ncbi:ankyrin repeat domain-containing protein 61-like [Leuresthes tenuis]|uniref:ankyrin repeat domain-containing protein 61-like n=1 Tax=Leuresthes tenuis TaxID=355514 RepID=UPI003B50B9CD
MAMLQLHKEHPDKGGRIINLYNNEFYTAIMDQDLERIEDMSKKYGSNCQIEIQGDAPGEVFWKATLPLHLAASYRRVHSVQSLLSAGADTEMRDQFGRTPLHLAVTGWVNIQATSSKPDSKFGRAAISAHRQAEACLRLLCEHGVNINARVEGSGHETALHISVQYKALSAVQILTSYGADVDAVCSSGMTPLHMAASFLHKDIIVNLIRQGADVNMGTRQFGNTPLHLAVTTMATNTAKSLDNGLSCISELLEQGADPNIMNKAGLTPLHEACIMGMEELVDLLLRNGAHINKLSKARENCLFLFLNRRCNVKKRSLLIKLLSLTSSPLTVFDQNDRLPLALTEPRFFKQRDQLLRLLQQPRRLQDICKSDIYLKCVGGRKEELKRVLPERLYDFVFHNWEVQHISFETDCEQDFLK